MKKIKINTDYITLGQFLKFVGMINNGGEAKIFLNEHKVSVNNEKENRRGRKLYPSYIITINDADYIVDK